MPTSACRDLANTFTQANTFQATVTYADSGTWGAGGISASYINAVTGFKLNGAAAAGNYLRGDGVKFVASVLLSGDITTALGYTPPTPTGTGASGTWGISITGSATYAA